MNQELTPQLLNCLFSLWTSFDKLRYSHFFQGEGKILDYLYLSESGCASSTQIGHSLHFSSPRVAAALNNLQKNSLSPAKSPKQTVGPPPLYSPAQAALGFAKNEKKYWR